MYLNRAGPTLSGQQTGAFDAMTVTALAVTGNASVAGLANLSSLSGACITDSLTTYSSTRAASAAAVATLNASLSSSMSAYMPLAGGNITGPLAVNGMLYASNISVLGSFETVVRRTPRHVESMPSPLFIGRKESVIGAIFSLLWGSPSWLLEGCSSGHLITCIC